MSKTNGARAIDKIKSTFDGGRRSFEWPGVEGLTLWFPPITPARWSRARALARDPDDTNELGMRLLLVCAETEDGELAFALGDYSALRNNTKVMDLQTVVNFMTETGPAVLTEASVRDADKLVDADPT